MVWLGLAWFGLVWLGLAWFGLVWLGLAWLGLAWFEGLMGRVVSSLPGCPAAPLGRLRPPPLAGRAVAAFFKINSQRLTSLGFFVGYREMAL